MTIDTSRLELHFDTRMLMKGSRVDIVGCGAVGSKIAMEAAKLGVDNIHLWDGDEVEAHNIANQDFWLEDIGKPKAVAVAERIEKATGITPVAHETYIEEGMEIDLGDYVFLAVDTMSARSDIAENYLINNFITSLVIEVRMGVEELRVYGFNPCKRNDIIRWRNTLVDDSKTVESACSAKITVGPVASITASLAVVRMMQGIKWADDPEKQEPPKFEQILGLNPLFVLTS